MKITLRQMAIILVLAALMVKPIADRLNKSNTRRRPRHRHFAYGYGRAGEMKQLGLGLLGYSGDHSGNFPASLWDLYPDEIGSARMLASPADIVHDPSAMGIFERYHYLGAGQRDDHTDSTETPVLIYPFRSTRTGPYNMTVLYIDGHVELMSYPTPREVVSYVLKHKQRSGGTNND